MLCLYVVWGTTYLGIKVGLDAELPPALFAGLRCLPAGAILLGIARMRGVELKVRWSDMRIIAIIGILLLVGGQYGTFLAEQRIPSGLAALVVALLPLWIALAESALPDMRRPGALGWLGLVIGFSGLGILIWPRLAGLETGQAELVGIATQILATWLWTTGSVVSKRRPVDVDPMVVTAYEMFAAGIVLVVLGTALGEWGQLTLTPKGAGALAYLTIVGSCIGFMAFVYAMQHLPASKVMTYAYVNPVIAVFAGWLAGRVGLVPPEPVDGSMLVGMAVIVAGVALAIASPTRPSRIEARTAANPLADDIAEPSPLDA